MLWFIKIKAANLCDNIVCRNQGVCNVVLKAEVPTSECWCLKSYAGYYCELDIVPGKI